MACRTELEVTLDARSQFLAFACMVVPRCGRYSLARLLCQQMPVIQEIGRNWVVREWLVDGYTVGGREDSEDVSGGHCFRRWTRASVVVGLSLTLGVVWHRCFWDEGCSAPTHLCSLGSGHFTAVTPADDWLVSFKIESSTGGVSQSPVLVDIDGVGNYKNFQSNSKWLVLLTERLLLLWVVQSQNSAASLAEVLEVPHNFKLPMDFVFPPSHFASDKIVVASGNGEVSFIDLQASANAHALVNTYIGKLARPDPCKIWWVSGQQGEMQGDLLVVSHKPLEMSGRIMSVFDMYNRTALDLLPSQHWGALASQPTHICANFKSNWCTKAGRDASAPVPIIEVASRRTLGILRVTEPPTPEDEWMWW